MELEQIYRNLVDFTGAHEAVIWGRLQAVMDCPYCLKASEPDDVHSSFGRVFDGGDGWGFFCFVCGTAVGLHRLADDLGLETAEMRHIARPSSAIRNANRQLVARQAEWLDQAESYLESYLTPDRYELWYNYRLLEPATVDKYHLGVGVLPASRCHTRRLITPIMDYRQHPIWFRGRRYLPGDTEAKWLASGGVSLNNVPLIFGDRLESNKVVFITENMLDAILIRENSNYEAIPTLSVSYWQQRWTTMLKKKKPKAVIVAYDADLAGNGAVSSAHFETLVRKRIAQRQRVDESIIALTDYEVNERGWRIRWANGREIGEDRMPQPGGIKLANRLNAAGIPTRLFPWTEEQAGRDIGDVLMEVIQSDS